MKTKNYRDEAFSSIEDIQVSQDIVKVSDLIEALELVKTKYGDINVFAKITDFGADEWGHLWVNEDGYDYVGLGYLHVEEAASIGFDDGKILTIQATSI